MLYMKRCFLVIYTLTCMCTLDAATLFVTNLLDDGSPGSLRETIENATSGDTIQFSVAGTITLEEERGSLLVLKSLTIDGQNKITIDGANLIRICFIIGGISTKSLITNLTIQNFNGHQVRIPPGTAIREVPAFGISVNPFVDCSVINTTIKNIHSGFGSDAAGIYSLSNMSNITNNTIFAITSEDNPDGRSGSAAGINISDTIHQNCSHNTIYNVSSGLGSIGSGAVFGISTDGIFGHCSSNTIFNLISGDTVGRSGNVTGTFVRNSLNGHCYNNIIQHLSSGNAKEFSGQVFGIRVLGAIEGNCSDNTIQHLTPGTADRIFSSAGIFCNSIHGNCLNNLITDITIANTISAQFIWGIQFSFVETNSVLACNTIARVSGGKDGSIFGIEIEEANAITIKNNTIDMISSRNGAVYGMRLGSAVNNTFFSNSLVLSNTINSIKSDNLNGLGIAIFGNESIGNDLLANSIFDINAKAIDILDNGIPTDARVCLVSARCSSGCKLTIIGRLIPSFNATLFKVQFFVSDSNTPAQTQTLIGEHVHDTTQGVTFEVAFSKLPLIEAGQFITAIATALPPGSEQNNNTSEVSNAIPACKTFGNFCPCPPQQIPPDSCPIINC